MLLELFIEELIRLVAENYLWKCETIEYFSFTLIPLNFWNQRLDFLISLNILEANKHTKKEEIV